MYRRSATLEDRMHHLESLIQSIPTGMFNGNPASMGMPSNGVDGVALPQPGVSYPTGVPPPSLNSYPLMNPSTHFPLEELSEAASRLSIAPTYLYFDDEGSTRWQGETSGLPLLDMLVERSTPPIENNHEVNGHGHNHRQQSMDRHRRGSGSASVKT